MNDQTVPSSEPVAPPPQQQPVPLLARVLPESWRPYAKTVYAFVLGLVGLLVSLFIIDDETGAQITQAATTLAMLLGVYEAPNVKASTRRANK